MAIEASFGGLMNSLQVNVPIKDLKNEELIHLAAAALRELLTTDRLNQSKYSELRYILYRYLKDTTAQDSDPNVAPQTVYVTSRHVTSRHQES